jgi:IclR family transcriptional regulator, KDG regulon repressor
VNALDKVVAMLEAFLPEGRGLRLSELCQITGLSKSTASALAHALIKRGYLRQDGERGPYFLGVRFIEFGNVVQMNLHVGEVARPFMTELCARANETVELAVRDGRHAAVLESVRGKRMLSAASDTGRWAARVSLKNTACGKILAAYMNPAEWKAIRGSIELTGGTAKTIVNAQALEKQLEEVRRSGSAVDDEEVELGIRSIASPVFDGNGRVCAALYIIAPKSRLTNTVMEEFAALVKACALQISKAMGLVDSDNRHGAQSPHSSVSTRRANRHIRQRNA